MYCKLKSGKRCQCFFFEIVIATSDRKIVQMTSSTTVPFLASFSPPTSHGQASPLCICLDCACSLAWTHFWCTVQLILIFLKVTVKSQTVALCHSWHRFLRQLSTARQVRYISCLDCVCSLAWTHFWCTENPILIFLIVTVKSKTLTWFIYAFSISLSFTSSFL